MSKLVVLLVACGLMLAACADGGGGPGRASPDPADQSPNH